MEQLPPGQGAQLSVEVIRGAPRLLQAYIIDSSAVGSSRAQARLSGYIVSALPFFMFFWINVVNPGYMKTMYDHPWGVYILGAGVLMQLIGWLIIRKIVAIEV